MEIWKDIPGYEGKYQVSNLGCVKALNYNKTGKEQIMVQQNIRGYRCLNLSKNGTIKHYFVHRLVWIAFNGEIPDGMQVNHINEDKSDNRLENLNLMTPKENTNWGTGNERKAIAQTNGILSKPVIQYDLQGNVVAEYPSAQEAHRKTGFLRANISNCCRGVKHVKTVGGYIWRYA